MFVDSEHGWCVTSPVPVLGQQQQDGQTPRHVLANMGEGCCNE